MRMLFPVLAAALLLTDAARAQPAAEPPAAAGMVRSDVEGCPAPTAFSEVKALGAKAATTGAPGVSVAVVCRGQLVFTGAWGELSPGSGEAVTPHTVFRLASVTKPITAAAILKLAEQGRLKLTDRLSKHLPDFPGAQRITLYHLLTHTSGLADFTEDASYGAHKTRPHTTAEMIAWIRTLDPPTRFAPGRGWAYSNAGYVLLGAVIEKVTGQPLARAYDDLLLLPADAGTVMFEAGAGRLSRRAQDPARPWVQTGGHRRNAERRIVPADPIDMSIPGAAGGLRGTAADFARVADAVFRGRLISPAAAASMGEPGRLTDGRPNRWGMPEDWREGLQADYGLGLFIDDRVGRRRWSHAGDIDGFHTIVVHYPAEQVTILILRNGENGNPMEDEIQAAVLKELGR